MGRLYDFIADDEPGFLTTYGKDRANDLKNDRSLPRFYRDMYTQWFRYYKHLIPHLQGNPNSQENVYKNGLGGKHQPGVDGQNEVLADLQAELVRLENGASGTLVPHLQALRELLNIEETTNDRLVQEPPPW